MHKLKIAIIEHSVDWAKILVYFHLQYNIYCFLQLLIFIIPHCPSGYNVCVLNETYILVVTGSVDAHSGNS